MPSRSLNDRLLLAYSTCTPGELTTAAAAPTRHQLPLADVVSRIVSDRLSLAGDHLRAGDQLLLSTLFRSSISRHYYAMYHAGRAIAFAHYCGDDYQKHSRLPRNLPPSLSNVARRVGQLTDARLLRNEADYDIYPIDELQWRSDAQNLAVVAAEFVQACEEFALVNGHI